MPVSVVPEEVALDNTPLNKIGPCRTMPEDAIAMCVITKAGCVLTFRSTGREPKADHLHITEHIVVVKTTFMQDFLTMLGSVYGVSVCETPGHKQIYAFR